MRNKSSDELIATHLFSNNTTINDIQNFKV